VEHPVDGTRIEADLAGLGIDSPGGFAESANRFMSMIRDRGRVINLIGPGETGRLWERHLLESAAFSLLLDRSRPVADIGSGAGFPGIVLALLGFEATLIEPRRNRALFLEYASRELGLPQVTVVRCRFEDWSGASPQFTARALMPLDRLLVLMEKLGHSATLTVRVSPDDGGAEGAIRSLVLPVPPLDRPGVLAQYRIPIRRPGAAASTRKAFP